MLFYFCFSDFYCIFEKKTHNTMSKNKTITLAYLTNIDIEYITDMHICIW